LRQLFLEHLEERLYFCALRAPGEEPFVGDIGIVRKVAVDEAADLVSVEFRLHLVDLVDAQHAAVDHELQFDQREMADLVEIEQVEEDWSFLPTVDLLLELGRTHQSQTAEELEGVDEAVLVCVPNDERRLVGSEDLLELGKVDGQVVAHTLE
jgi:hypothetical protein